VPYAPTARPLTIGIDARAATEVGAGRGRVVRELLRELAVRPESHRYRCYARTRWDDVPGDRLEWVLVAARDPWWNILTARRATRECDVFLSTNSYLTTWFLGIPGVPIVYDLVTFEAAMRPNRRSAVIERLTIGLAVHRSAAFVAISAATARALAARYPEAAGRTTIALLGVAPALDAAVDGRGPDAGLTVGEPGRPPAPGEAKERAARPSREIADRVCQLLSGQGSHSRPLCSPDAPPRGPGPAGDVDRPVPGDLPPPGFVLAVGTLEPRKNLPRLVEAYRRLAPALQAAHPLVVVGALGWETGETLAALESLGDRAIPLGYVADAALAELYRRCAVFCYPSLGEGFGLPVLEAMAAGAPVLTADVSSLPEVGGYAAAYADPYDVDSIADALGSLLADPPRRAELARRGPLRAAEFSWAGFAATVLRTLEDVA
jgi:glycosyltransferase involved in cell wall biosynthesis